MGPFLTLLRWAGVAVIVAAIVAQMKVLADAGRLDAVNFLSFFTIQSNLVGAAALAATAIRGDRRPRWVDWLRGAATVYLTITFVVVIALLQGIDVGLQLAWVDFALHKLSPVIVLLDFVLDPPRTRLSIRDALLWLVYPLVWLAYTLVRGAALGWYPYPFLDPAHGGGYAGVAATSLIILVAGAVLCLAFAWLGNRLGSRLSGRPAA
jgi:hypothetical protein